MKKKSGIITFLILLLISSSSVIAQENPYGIKWQFIDTGNYRIIFSAELTAQAQEVANLMEYYEKSNYNSIKASPSFIPIVLINNITDPNGFVSSAPFYSHWFTTPSAFSSIEWFQSLAIHEGRHMTQMNKLKSGPGKGTWRVLFGESGSALFQTLYVPVWFMEGDAVNMETALTWGGRGRLPWFSLWQRTLELSDTRYSYYRAYLGSYNDLYPYPDYYSLGYLLSTHIRKNYGKDVWDEVLNYTGKYFVFYNFSRSLKIVTGKNISELYQDALNEYRLMWKQQIAELKITDADLISPVRSKKWDSYYYPHPLSKESVAAILFTRDKKLSLVKINPEGKTEKIIHVPLEIVNPALRTERNISIAGGKFLWREKKPDLRWGYKNYSNLKILNIESGKTKILTSKGKYISSALSKDGSFAAGVEYTSDLKYYINILDTKDGKILQQSEVADAGFIYDPAISEDGKDIAFASFTNRGNRLVIFNIENQKFTTIIDYTRNEQIKAPVFYKNYILYSSNYSGIDNIYAIDIDSKKKFQITSRPYGAYFPAVSAEDDTLYFNDYSVNGYRAASMELNVSSWVPLEKVTVNKINDIQPIVDQELPNGLPDEMELPTKEYDVKKYYPALHLINIYGWAPGFNSNSREFFFSVFSRDVLHTTEIFASYIRNFNESTNAVQINAVYSGLYPVVSITGGYGSRALRLDKGKSESGNKNVSWKESKIAGGLALPFNLTRGIHKTFFTASANGGLIKVTDKDQENIGIYQSINKDGYLGYWNCTGMLSHIMENNLNAVAPRMGQVLNISYWRTTDNSDYQGNLFSSDLELFLPGFLSSHSIKLTGAFEYLNFENYAFQSRFLYPRGYDEIRHTYFLKGGIDYAFPIINLSLNLWKITYIKRIQGALFFDYGAGKTGKIKKIYPSAGVELTVKQNILTNIYLDIETGLRYSRCIETNENKYEFVIRTPL